MISGLTILGFAENSEEYEISQKSFYGWGRWESWCIDKNKMQTDQTNKWKKTW